MILPFHSYRLRSRKAAQTRLLNCYASAAPPEGRSPSGIQGMAGIRAFSTIAAGPQRAGISFQNDLYTVAGSSFCRVDAAGSATEIGSVDGSGTVDIDKNTTQIAILIEPNLWVYQSGALAQVTDTDFPGAKRMAVLDNYGGFVEPDTGRFFICDLGDFTVYDPLDYATAEGYPDNLLSIESNNRQFVLFGEDSIELWENLGGSDFPFQRVPNGFVENGLGAAYSTCAADNTVFWLDQDRIFRRLEGNIPKRISTEGVEQQWQDYSRIDDATAYDYVHDGHTFIVVRFPSEGATWVYDINTNEWHERESYGYDHWRAAWVAKCYGKTLVGDTQSGNIGEIHSTTYTEWGDILSREATSGVVYGETDFAFHDRLELDMDVGNGLESGQGSDPVVMLDISNNGGVDFRALPNRSIGTTGQYSKRVHWDGLGRSRERVYRIRCTDPVPFVISAARLKVRL